MLRFRNNAGEADEELINLTSMVDVVFILLSFFVLTTRFIGEERELMVGGATESGAAGLQAGDLPATVRVQISPAASGGVAIRLGQVTLPDNGFAELTARLTALDLPQLPVVIAADERLPIAAVAQGMQAVLDSPNQNVSLAPLRLQGEQP